MSDAVRRGLRTFFQSFVGVLVLQLGAVAGDVSEGNWVPDVDWLKRVAISATVAGAIALVSFIQNWLEDNSNFPAVGKAVASSGVNPVTHAPSEVNRP